MRRAGCSAPDTLHNRRSSDRFRADMPTPPTNYQKGQTPAPRQAYIVTIHYLVFDVATGLAHVPRFRQSTNNAQTRDDCAEISRPLMGVAQSTR